MHEAAADPVTISISRTRPNARPHQKTLSAAPRLLRKRPASPSRTGCGNHTSTLARSRYQLGGCEAAMPEEAPHGNERAGRHAEYNFGLERMHPATLLHPSLDRSLVVSCSYRPNRRHQMQASGRRSSPPGSHHSLPSGTAPSTDDRERADPRDPECIPRSRGLCLGPQRMCNASRPAAEGSRSHRIRIGPRI